IYNCNPTKNALEQIAQGRCEPRYHLGWGALPPLCRRRHAHACVGEGASRSRGTQPANLGERLEAGDWRLVIVTSLQSLISRLWFRRRRGRLLCHRYGEGFGAGLLVELALSSTRWAPGAARTVPCQRRLRSFVAGQSSTVGEGCQSGFRMTLPASLTTML